MSKFFLRQLLINSAYGVFITAALWAIGIPSPIVWGMLAALMRFVPFIGSYIAAIPPLLLAAWSTRAGRPSSSRLCSSSSAK